MNKKMLSVAMLVIVVTTMTIASAQEIPSTVRGYVGYENGTLINGVTVNVTRTDTETGNIESKEVITDTEMGTGLNGYYSVGFTSVPGRNYSYVIRARFGTFSNITNVPPTSAIDLVVNLTLLPKGDVDGYPGITMADAMYIGKAALNMTGFPQDVDTMDIDNDGEVTIEDAKLVAEYVIGLRSSL